MIDDRNCTYGSEAKMRGLAAQLNQDPANDDGWVYTAKPIGPAPETLANRAHQRWWYVEVTDADGYKLGNL